MVVAVQQRPDEYVLLSGIRWETYVTLADESAERRIRMTYDDGDLEIMTSSLGIERASAWLGHVVAFLAVEFQRPICSGGSTTLQNPVCKKALEPYQCFWIEHEKTMRGKKEWRAPDDPPPDLVVDIDTCTVLDRLRIYAALGVPEVWRYDGERLALLVLGRNGEYRAAKKSHSFGELPVETFIAFLGTLGTEPGADDEISMMHSVIEWVRGLPSHPSHTQNKSY